MFPVRTPVFRDTLLVCLCISCQIRGATIWNEATQGDLSGNGMMPNSFTLAIGNNELLASSQRNDLEFVTLTVPVGSTMTGLFLRSYDGLDSIAFLALQRGTTFTESPSAPNRANLLGYSHFGPGFIGTNMLPTIGNASGAQGFTPPLPADSYTFWLQQTGGATDYQFDFVVSGPPVPTWNIDANGNWGTTNNWTGGVPNTIGGRAVFGSVITAPRTVTVNGPVTVGRIDFDNPNSYTLAGTNPIALSASSGSGAINVTNGSHSISTRVALASDATIDVAPAASNLSISGDLLGADVNVTKHGAGTLTINHMQASRLSIDGGNVALATGAGVNASVLGELSIAGTAAAPTARFDINSGSAIVDYTGSSPLVNLRSQLLAGRGGAGFGAAWTGQGITSAAAAVATEPESRSVGFAENATMPLGPYTTFRGQPVDDTSILMAFTRTGDANLDGVVNDDDVTILGASFAPGVPQASWALGDFDYNGFVDDDDVTLLGAFYDPTAQPLIALVDGSAGPAGLAPVPEPASVALALLAAALIALAGLLRTGRRPYTTRL